MEELLKLATAYQERRSEAGALISDDEFIPKFLELEERRRGSAAGLQALSFVVRNGGGYGDPSAVASRARVTACERLQRFYLDHAEADACFASLSGGVSFPEAADFLQAFAEKSPHEHVQAAAWLYFAQELYKKSRLPTLRKRVADQLASDDADEMDRKRKQLEAWSRFGDIDEDRVRSEAAAAAEHVRDSYVGVGAPPRSASGPAGVLMTRDESAFVDATYAERAESLLFEITRLQIGMAAPDISGTDADGVEFRLSDYRGRVVVLMFSADWCGPCQSVYPVNRDMLEKYADEPFAVLSVMADMEADTVKKAHEEGEITWRAMWDGFPGVIAARWNVRGWPTLIIIDHRGVIRYRNPVVAQMPETVAKLLEVRSADAEADELLSSHPVAESEMLRRAREAAKARGD